MLIDCFQKPPQTKAEIMSHQPSGHPLAQSSSQVQLAITGRSAEHVPLGLTKWHHTDVIILVTASQGSRLLKADTPDAPAVHQSDCQ